MGRSLLSFFCLGFLFLCQSVLSGALEIELAGGINNMTLQPESITASPEGANYRGFQEYSMFYGEFALKNEISDKLGYNIAIVMDNILLNSLNGKVTANTDYVNFEFGLFAGIGDSLEKPDAGIMGKIKFFYPGVVFLSLHGSSTLGSKYDFTSGNFRETAGAELGFWFGNFIPAVSAEVKGITRKPENAMTIHDELIRLHLGVDIFAKNFPVILRAGAGYEILTRSYNGADGEITGGLNALFAGLELELQVTKSLRITAGCEVPFLYTAEKPMQKPGSFLKLFNAYGGIAYTFF
jgi:hypothetical protein